MTDTKHPDFVLRVKARDASRSLKVGAAWRTKDGKGLNIRLEPGVSIGGPDIDITLWPWESREEREARFGDGKERAKFFGESETGRRW